ncbi:MAG TPA: TetR/AcrR family transcriptional regulator [Bryobacteraceae bacterium]|nr:TetR/AcrR family transcriptional regulator [Bryobacteraceae bacterium]
MLQKVNEPARKGRPRSEEAHQAILAAALQLVFEDGFRSVSIDAIAAKADVGRATIYRRWPNKAAIVMDAFLQDVGPNISFPSRADATESLRTQMRLLAKAFRGKHGALIKALLGEAQFDPELAEAFRERWIRPRRESAMVTLREAMAKGQLRADIDLDTAIDALYGGIYYRLQIGNAPLSDSYIDSLFQHVVYGLRGPMQSLDSDTALK